jgi:choline transport protein
MTNWVFSSARRTEPSHSNMYYALQNGGPAAWFFSYIVVVFGALCQAASFAEMASIQPIAGAQYYWTHVRSIITTPPRIPEKMHTDHANLQHLAPSSLKLFLTWLQGWITWTSYVSMIASAFNSNTVLLEATIQLEHPDYVNGGWHTTLIVFAGLAFSAFINIYVFRIVPWFELVAGILNICLFFIFLVVLWVISPRNSPEIFLVSNMSSGWDNYFVACNVGALSNIFLFISKIQTEGVSLTRLTKGIQALKASSTWAKKHAIPRKQCRRLCSGLLLLTVL